ncbi:sulfatase/phosphatase domain-containing protein [Paenibacillus thalictri]
MGRRLERSIDVQGHIQKIKLLLEQLFTIEPQLFLKELDELIDSILQLRKEQIHIGTSLLRIRLTEMVSMCDAYLGKLLDLMDELNMWEDTMLIVNTDQGFLLGEHDWWGKNRQPFYNEIAHISLFIWDRRSGKRGERRQSLVQMIDMAPTLLEFFDCPIPQDVMGQPLREVIESDAPVRDALLFGIHGGHVNCTDGRYVYMRGPVSLNGWGCLCVSVGTYVLVQLIIWLSASG